MSSLFRAKPKLIKEMVLKCLFAGLVPFIQSSPGMGKSALVHQISTELNLKLIDHRLTSSVPEDMSGLPRFAEDGYAYYSPFAGLFPLETMELPEGKQGWLLFLDEFNSASKAMQAACYKLILDRMVGQHKLHPNVVIVCAGNLASDRAIVTPLGTAMQSRVIHLEMETDFDNWLEEVALKQDYDPRIIAFLSMYNDKLNDFNPDHLDKTFCCQRTWEFMNSLIKDEEVLDKYMPMYAGTITCGVAVEFVQFCAVYKNLVTITQVLADPLYCHVPQDTAIKWATVCHLVSKINNKNLADILIYIARFTTDFRILFYRSILAQDPTIRHHKDFAKPLVDLSNYLYG